VVPVTPVALEAWLVLDDAADLVNPKDEVLIVLVEIVFTFDEDDDPLTVLELKIQNELKFIT
jgi:hypothetical protein